MVLVACGQCVQSKTMNESRANQHLVLCMQGRFSFHSFFTAVHEVKEKKTQIEKQKLN